MSVDSTIRKAQKLAKAGDRDGAAALLKQVLAKSPGNKVAQRGLTALARAAGPRPPAGPGRGAQAPAPRTLAGLETLLKRPDPAPAIAEAQRLSLLFPTSKPVFNLLGIALSKGGRHDEALKAFARLAELDPEAPGPLVNTANVLVSARRYDEAAEAAAAALAREPRLARAASVQGFALTQAGRLDEAEAAYRTVIRLAPDRPEGHLGLGHVLSRGGRLRDSLAAYHKALAAAPTHPEAANNVGATLVALGRLDEAVDILGRAIEQHPGHRMLRSNMAKALRDLDRPEAAIAEIDAALEHGPETGNLLAVKIDCLGMIGEIDAAKELLARGRDLAPDDIDLWVARSQIDPGSFDEADGDRMAAALADDSLAEKARARLAFALFRAQDHAGEIDAAAASLATGNTLQRHLRPYDIDADARRFAALAAMFDDVAPVLSEDDIADMPSRHRIVFVTGMPRSGTTLVEQILASHSQVHAAGELRLLSRAMQAIGWDEDRIGGAPTRQNLRALRRSYLDGIAKLGIDAPVVTDKMPLNSRHLGHALAAFPEARALVLERDARAVCWSNWSHDFRGRGNGFGNDMGDLARMYHMHRTLVDTYRTAYPDRLAMVPYERLTEDQEAESRKLVAAAGLDWEAACLAFHETRRAVKTASAVQVRQKMYSGSSEAWRRYEAHLGPLFAALAAEG